MSEYIQNLLQSVSALSQEGCPDVVGTQVDHLVEVLGADILDFFVLSVVGVVVHVEAPPVEQLVSDRDLGDVFHHREITENLHSLLNLFYFLPLLGSLKVVFIAFVN